ncbi:hypothetical protein EPN15_03025 [Patescibacteria group bacterium]|nr:MAG: hypothetical protein EPN15_03025 [Patescibacteria group bacterium]
MNREVMQNKVWYRAIKVIFVGVFLLVQAFGFFLTYTYTNEKMVDPTSFEHAGSVIKEKFPEYSDLSNEAVGQKLFGNNKVLTQEQFQSMKDRGLTFDQIVNLVKYTQKYSILEKIGFYVLSFVVVAIIFYLISRIFFYVLSGEKFFSL